MKQWLQKWPFAVVALLALGGVNLTLYGEECPGGAGCSEPLPVIPSPHEVERDDLFAEDKLLTDDIKLDDAGVSYTGFRPFPVKKITRILKEYNQYRPVNINELQIEEWMEYLGDNLKPGNYLFDEACPLLVSKIEDGKIAFRLNCLNDERLSEQMVITLDYGAELEWLAELSTTQLELTAGLQLISAEIGAGGLTWKWSKPILRYRNPYLEYLHKRQPDFSYSELVDSINISRYFKELMGLTTGLSESRSRDLQAVIPVGTSIHFGRSCPLRLKAEPRREIESGLVSVVFEIDCFLEPEFRRAVILIPDNHPILEKLQKTGNLYGGLLKFHRFYQVNDKYLPIWDTIIRVIPYEE